ncbi:cell division protein FtsZ, partial [Euryarchaeota archaeon ex4484_178]
MKFLERNDKATEEIAKITAPEDEELRELVEKLRVNIKIIGCGGGGSNTINRMMEEGVYGAELIAANTDAQHLLHIKANRKILLGKRRTRGLGAGSDPLVGEDAAREASEELERLLQNADMVFVTAGLGGGTGTGSAPYIAKVAKEAGALVLSVVTLPFKAEGKLRMENALWGLERLRHYSDTTIVIPNDKLLELVPRLPLNEAFK